MSPVPDLRPTRAEVDAGAIARNVGRIAAAAGAEVCAVVKADGYGHGAVTAARAALAGGATWLAVALVEEGAVLRDAGVTAPVLLLSEPTVAAVPHVLDLDLTPTVYSAPFVAALDAAGRGRGRPVPVHAMLDSGMGRVGAPPADWPALLDAIAAADVLVLEGVETHLARADEPSVPTTAVQLARLVDGLGTVRARGLAPTLLHVANTAAALAHAEAVRAAGAGLPDAAPLVRAGIGVYGLDPGGEVRAADHGLEPALRILSAVSFVKRIAAGTPVSYGHRWSAPADGWLATVPIGYADGVPRALGGRGDAVLGGRRRPVAGTVTMDQLLLWCGDDAPDVGDEVVLVGTQGTERIGMEEWAASAGTITYEVATGLGPRLPRVVVDAAGTGG
jgi:alanine racemase